MNQDTSTRTEPGGAVRGWAIFCAVFAVVNILIFRPRAAGERRLRRHGRVTTAVCRAHLNALGDGPIRVRCGHRLCPDGAEFHAVVRTREHIPQVGEEFKVVYDPREPNLAESLDVTRTPLFGREDIFALAMWTGLFLVGTGCSAAAG